MCWSKFLQVEVKSVAGRGGERRGGVGGGAWEGSGWVVGGVEDEVECHEANFR